MDFSPPPVSLRQLQYVLAVAETLSFRKAAERCHVAQPSLSAQIATLEDAIGVRLFERDRRRVLTTTAGRALVERARRVLLEVDDIVTVARQASDPLAGTLRIGIIPTISPYLLPHVAPAMRRAHARLSLLWSEDKTADLMRQLDDGTLDAAIVALEAELGGAPLEAEEIAIDPFVLAAPRGHPLLQGTRRLRREQLRDVDVLLLDEGHCLRTQALDFCTRARAHGLAYRATSLTTLTQMVASGAGVTLLPLLAVPTEAKRARLQVRAFVDPQPSRTIALVWRRRSPLPDALRTIARTMRAARPVRG